MGFGFTANCFFIDVPWINDDGSAATAALRLAVLSMPHEGALCAPHIRQDMGRAGFWAEKDSQIDVRWTPLLVCSWAELGRSARKLDRLDYCPASYFVR